MSRRKTPRHNTPRRLCLETLEGRNLPGEALLSALAAGFATDQLSSEAAASTAPTPAPISPASVGTSTAQPTVQQGGDASPMASSPLSSAQQPSVTTTIAAPSGTPDEFGILTPTQIGALFQTTTATAPPSAPQDPPGGSSSGGGGTSATTPPPPPAGTGGSTPGGTVSVTPPGGSTQVPLPPPPPPAGGTIGDRVWQDANKDGIQQTGEAGVSAVPVYLLNAGTQAVVAMTGTDMSGQYRFTNVPAGTYQVQFLAPPMMALALAHQGSDAASDSDADPATGRTQAFTLGASETRLDLDAGLRSAVPVLGSLSGRTNAEGDTVSLSVPVIQPNGPLTFSAVNLPAGLGIDPTTGLISGTIDYAAAEQSGGHYATTVTAVNGGGSAGVSFGWDVTDTVRAPVLSNPGNQTSERGADVSLQMQASQPDDEAINFQATGLPPGLYVDDAGLIAGTVSAGASDLPYAVTVTANVGSQTASQTFTWAVIDVNHAPTLDSPGDQSGHAGDAVWLSLSASDADQDPLSYAATGLPAGLTIEQSTGVISGTLLATADGAAHPVTLTVSDGTASSSQTVLWTVSPLSLDSPGDQTNATGDAVSLPVVARSAAGASLGYSVTGLPPGLTIDAATGLISGVVADPAGADHPYTVTVGVTDGVRSESQSFSWSVASILLAGQDAQSSATGDVISLQLAVSYHGGNALQWTADGLPQGLGIDAGSGLISGTIGLSAGQSQTQSVTVSVTDGTVSASQTFPWSVWLASDLAPVVGNPGDAEYSVAHNGELSVAAPGPFGQDSARQLPPWAVHVVTGPLHGTLALGGTSDGTALGVSDGSFSYRPDPQFVGTDRFTYKIVLDGVESDVGTVTIHVTNAAPVASPDDYIVSADQVLEAPAGALLANDSDADGDALTAELVSDVSHGILDLRSDGSFAYTPNPAYAGSDSFTYRVSDTLNAVSDAVMVSLHVTREARPVMLGKDAAQGAVWLSQEETEEFGVALGVEGNPYTAQLLAEDVGNSAWTRRVRFDPVAVSVTGGVLESPGTLVLPATGDVVLSVTAVRPFASGEVSFTTLEVSGLGADNLPFIKQAKPVQLKGAKVRIDQVAFTSDHKLIRENRTDFLKSGKLYPDIVWDVVKRVSAPISHTGGQSVTLFLTLSTTNVAANTPFLIEGQSQTSGFQFQSKVLKTGQGAMTIANLTSTSALQKRPAALTASINWTMTLNPGVQGKEQRLNLGTSTHIAYVTLGRPDVGATKDKIEGNPEMQVTDKRMARAAHLGGLAWDNALKEQTTGKDAVPTKARLAFELLKLHKFNLEVHVTNEEKPLSAAWAVFDTWTTKGLNDLEGSDCVSGARLAEAVLKQLGMPEAEISVKRYRPKSGDSEKDAETVIEGSLAGVTRGAGKNIQWLMLLDHGKGDLNSRSNRYEGTVVFKDVAKGKTYYFPSGTKSVFDSPAKVLTVFHSLQWLGFGKDDKTIAVGKPVKVYKLADSVAVE